MHAGSRITAIVAAFNEADIIQQTVGDLVQQGIAVHVIDDGSTDGTAQALEPLLASGLVRIERCPQPGRPGSAGEFSLARILGRKEQLARELDADWFVNHDADEFRESVWRHLNLRQGIELVDRLGYNAIDFAVLNFWPTHDKFDGKTDIREVFEYFERGQEFNRVQVRCWKKAADIDLQSSAGHDARFASRSVFPLRFVMRHFPIRGQAHGRRKVFEERKPRFADDERGRGWHVQYDGLDEGHRFTRDPDTLERYDPDAVRAQLQIEHRGVEALQLDTAALRETADRLSSQLETLGLALAAEQSARAAEAEEARREQERLVGELDARYAELRGQFDRLEQHYRDLERQSQDLARERGALLGSVADLERQLADIRQSWSWKVTSPLRALGRQRVP